MSVINHTPLDFDSLYNRFIEFMKQDEVFKDYNFESGGLNIIARQEAFKTMMTAFMGQQIFNELHLKKSQIRSNTASNSSLIGYTPKSIRGSQINATITVKSMIGVPITESLIMDKTSRFMGIKESASYVFSPLENHVGTYDTASGMYIFENIILKQGIWSAQTFDVDGTGIASYTLNNDNIDISTLKVYESEDVEGALGVEYPRFTNAFQLGPDEPVYFIEMNRDGYYNIEFGDGNVAKSLTDGNIVVAEYMVTDGDVANGSSSFVAASPVGGLSNVSISINDLSSYGGAEEESIESIKLMAPKNFGIVGGAVIPGNYESIVRDEVPGISDVTVWGGEDHIPKKYGYVMLAIKDESGDILSDQRKVDIISTIEKYNIGSITPIIVDPESFNLNLDVSIKYDASESGMNSEVMKAKVRDYIYQYSKNNLEFFGNKFIKSSLISFIDKIDPSILGNNISVKYEKVFTPVINVASSHDIIFNRKIIPGTVNVTGYDQASSQLYSPEFYMKDNGLGVLHSFMKTSDNTITTLSISAGTVEYETGYISIKNLIASKILPGGVSVESESDQVDVDITPVRGEYIVIKNINIETENVGR